MRRAMESLAHDRVQGRRARQAHQPERRRSHEAIRRSRPRRREASARTLLFDGEVAIFDQQRRSRFDWLRDPDPDAVATPPLLMAFDVMYLDDCDLTQLPLRERLGSPVGPQRARRTVMHK